MTSELHCNPVGTVPGSSVKGSFCRCKVAWGVFFPNFRSSNFLLFLSKPGYAGQLCDRCDTSAYLDGFGRCVSCFCNGLLDATCKPSALFYASEKSNFQSPYHGWAVVNRYTNYTSSYVSTNLRAGVFEFYGFEHEAYMDKWFFDAPFSFKGNRVTRLNCSTLAYCCCFNFVCCEAVVLRWQHKLHNILRGRTAGRSRRIGNKNIGWFYLVIFSAFILLK